MRYELNYCEWRVIKPMLPNKPRRMPLERSSPDGLVRGYGRAASEILSELASDLSVKKQK